MKSLRNTYKSYNVTEQRDNGAHFACSLLNDPELIVMNGHNENRYINDTGGFYEITS